MIYAKRDIYATVGEVRRLVAFAGQPVPVEYEGLVEANDTTAEPVSAATQPEPVAKDSEAEEKPKRSSSRRKTKASSAEEK